MFGNTACVWKCAPEGGGLNAFPGEGGGGGGGGGEQACSKLVHGRCNQIEICPGGCLMSVPK